VTPTSTTTLTLPSSPDHLSRLKLAFRGRPAIGYQVKRALGAELTFFLGADQNNGPCHAMPGERVASQVLFGQLRGTRPVGSPPVSLRSLMRKDVLLLNGGGGQVHGRRWCQQCMEKAA
jgi:hypothetical protein